ncbi:MAG: class I SAM-dependent methyltransferase [bacterium]
MRENDIRPDFLTEKYLYLLNKDIQLFLEQKEKFIEVFCPACGKNDYEFKFEKKGFKFVSCNFCETLFVNPRPSFKMLIDFYTNSDSVNFWDDQIFPRSENARRKKIFMPRVLRVLQLCKKYSLDKNSLIDVGAGFGTFCEEIEKLNYFENVIAVEPSMALAETCKKKGLTVIEKAIEDIDGLKASVITNFELIEHLFSPRDFLKSCYNALAKGGLFILTTPNIKGFDLLLLKEKSNNIMPPNHINYFNIKSLSILLKSCGFDILEVLTPGELDAELVRKKVINKEYDISKNPFLKNILIDEWDTLSGSFQEFLSKNKLSSHLWIVAKKSKAL